jgi:hypothetical protein
VNLSKQTASLGLLALQSIDFANPSNTNPSKELGALMTSGQHPANGIKLIIQKCKKSFELPENLDYYSAEDYSAAARKYLKWCLLEGRHENPGKRNNLDGQ